MTEWRAISIEETGNVLYFPPNWSHFKLKIPELPVLHHNDNKYYYNNPVIASVKTLSNSLFVLYAGKFFKKSNMVGLGGYLEVRIGEQRKQLCQSTRLGGQTSLGLTFFRLLSSSSNWRIRTSFVVSSSFSRRSSSCCRKNIRRSCVKKPPKKHKLNQMIHLKNKTKGVEGLNVCRSTNLILCPGWDILQQVNPIHHHTLLLLHWGFKN